MSRQNMADAVTRYAQPGTLGLVSKRFPQWGRAAQAGFTTVEMIVYLLVAVLVLTAVYQLLISQTRLYSKQRELRDVRSTVRGAANFLAWELRLASAADGDLYFIEPDSFAVRSVQGGGVVCGIHGSQSRYGLRALWGDFRTTADDSALIYSAGSMGVTDDVWLTGQISARWNGGVEVQYCFWGDSSTVTTQEVIEITSTSDLSGVQVGAPVRAFRRVQYGIFTADGRWWLGRKVGSAASYEILTGPLSAPADSGLVFVYYDPSGAPTTDPSQVSVVDIIVRGESFGLVRRRSGAEPEAQQDTLTLRVSLRG